MKKWIKRIAIFLMVSCLFLGSSQRAMADEILMSAELVEKYFGEDSNKYEKYYDVGSSVAGFELKSDSGSLKVGDTVEVQVVFNPEQAGFVLKHFVMDLYYDKDIFQYNDVIIRQEDNGKLLVNEGEGKPFITCVVTFLDGFNRNDCFMTVQFKVKREVSSATFFGTDIDSTGDLASYYFEDDLTEDGGLKVVSLIVKDEEPSVPAPALSFALADTNVQGSGEIDVPIRIKSNDGFAALGLKIDYDASLFTYEDLEIDNKVRGKIDVKDTYSTDGQVRAAYIAANDITDDGDFLHLKLKTKEGVAAGTTSAVTVSVTQVVNYAEASLEGTGATYTVTLIENITPEPEKQKIGDVNNDGKVDLLDALWILQNYNGVREFTDVERTAADVDRNNDVDLLDALKVMKFYNGEIDEF